MIKNYIKQMRQNLCRTAVLGILITSSGWLHAQLSGTVTLGTSGTYTTWESLASAISTNGVNGALTVNVISDLTTANTITFAQNATNPATSTNTIKINGGGYKLSSSFANAAIDLNGMDYLTIDRLVIQKTGTGTSQFGIIFRAGADYNTIQNCTIEYTALTTGSTAGGAYIAFTNSTTTASSNSTTIHNGSYNTITKNLMRTTNSNSPGPTFGISVRGGTSVYTNTPSNNTISNNTIENFFNFGTYEFYTNGDQFLNNDISRANSTLNNCNTSITMMYTYWTYSTNRATKYDGNNFHDLPFKGATTGSTGIVYGIFAYYNYGNTTNYFTFTNNTFQNIVCSSTNYTGYMWYNYYSNISDNKTINWRSLTTGAHYGYYMYYMYNELKFNNNLFRDGFTKGSTYFVYSFYPGKTEMNDNKVINNTTADGSTAFTYGFYVYYPSNNVINTFDRNVMDSNTFGSYVYCTYLFYFNGTMNQNKITNNRIYNANYSSYYGYIYGLFHLYYFNFQINNNIFANNLGMYGVMGLYGYSYNSGSYKFECKGNTVVVDAAAATYTYHYTYGLYLYPYYHNEIHVMGNIVDIQNSYGAYPVYTNNQNGSTAYKYFDYNTYWTKNLSFQYWYCPNGQANDFAGWKSLAFGGPNENSVDPMWKNKTSDFRSDCFETQNNVPQIASLWPTTPINNPVDQSGAARNPVKFDRGAYESYMNITASKTDLTLPATVCAGTEVKSNIYVKNKFVDTIYDFNVALEVKGGQKVTQKVTARILPGDSAEIKFDKSIFLTEAGVKTISVYVDAADDNLKDDTFNFVTTVLPAPGGAVFNISAKTTKALYQYGKPNDITVLNVPVIYDVPAPTKYSNSTYGTSSDWQAFVQAYTASGRSIPGMSFTAPASGTDMEVTFVTTDNTLEDSMLTMVIRVLDNNNNCDTFVKRNVFIYPSIRPSFNFPAQICEGESVLFENKSLVNSGSMEFMWDFGTGNSADNTEAPEPVFQFPSNGTYKVKLTAKTVPHGFSFDTIVDVTVNPIPTVAFTKGNACEGQELNFKNNSTPTTATMKWTFGDGSQTNTFSPKKKYTNPGTYNVTLSANLNGCVASLTQKVYQFSRPNADFTKVEGTCDNDDWSFRNNSTISSGLLGSIWDFDDNGTVSTDFNANHDFETYGSKKIQLVTTSEFGCSDTVTKSINVKESPKAAFINGPLCSVKPTEFTNTTLDVNGATANYTWNFGDGMTSGAKSPTHDWMGNLGPKTVTLLVSLDNGCSQLVSKDLVVLTQPKPNFSANDVCAGDDVIFVNNTTWAQGEITYKWDFGDGTTSANSDPTKKYNTTVTLTPFVTLYAYIAGGCGDSITQNITINETPRTCDFIATPDYSYGFYGMELEPVNGSGVTGGQDGVEYLWVYEGGGNDRTDGDDVDASSRNNFATDGTYKVTMRARMKQTGCECSITKTVVMNRASVEDMQKMGVAVYPNPSNGLFFVETSESFGQKVNIEMMSMSGSVVKRMTNVAGGKLPVDASDLSNGVYMVKVSNGTNVVTRKINIQN